MSIFRDIRRRAKGTAPQILAGALVAYFAYHAIQGERGINSWITLKEDLAASEAQLAALEAERARLDNRVRRLRRDSLDPDLLEERARLLLNYGYADDRVVMLPEARKGSSE